VARSALVEAPRQEPLSLLLRTWRGLTSAVGDDSRSRAWLGAALGGFAILTAVALYTWHAGGGPSGLMALGYVGVFIMMVISGGTIFIPMPGPPAIMAAGAILNPALVGIAAGFGNATGEITSYATGRAASSVLEKYGDARLVSFLRRWLESWGFLAILTLAAIPNPIFHIMSALAGATDYPAPRFWLACALGNCIKYGAFAYLGATAGALLFHW
jgi:membrane protein DedA with SNARE-associated domain